MYYSFDIQYYEQINQCSITVPIIMDLPQNSIQKVRLNPFVIDLVNHPFIKAGIEHVPNHSVKMVDNIQPFLASIPSTALTVTCRYQETLSPSFYKSFEFPLFVDIPHNCFLPIDPIVIICGDLYDAYEVLFETGRFVVSPRIPNTQVKIGIGNYYICSLVGSKDLLRVSAINNTSLIVDTVSEKGTNNHISISTLGISQVSSLRLNDHLLSLLGFSFVDNGSIYGLKNVSYFEGVLSRAGNAASQVFVKKERVGYTIIKQDSNTPVGCRLIPCFYLDELQYYYQQLFGASINLNTTQMMHICQYINDRDRFATIIEALPSVMERFYSQMPSATREQAIAFVASHFNVSPGIAQHLLILMYY